MNKLQKFEEIYNQLVERRVSNLYINKIGDDYIIRCKTTEEDLPADSRKELQAINDYFEFMKYYSTDRVIDFEYLYDVKENSFICNSVYNTNMAEIKKEENKTSVIDTLNKLKYITNSTKEIKDKKICIQHQNKKINITFIEIINTLLKEIDS